MEMLALPTITLLCVETRDPKLAHWAIERCWAGATFAKTVLITSLEKVKERKAGIEYVQAPAIKSTKDYSELLLSGLRQYVEGTHVLVIQWDSFVIHPELWTDEFLNYDYIGAVWPHHPQAPVGNGGFSLRSSKLLKALEDDRFVKKHPEDYCICVENKKNRRIENDFSPLDIYLLGFISREGYDSNKYLEKVGLKGNGANFFVDTWNVYIDKLKEPDQFPLGIILA